MDTEKCIAFMEVLAEKNLSPAAEKLGYTPSGISRMLDAMEKETGFPLLKRHRNGVSLTPEGEAMLPFIRALAMEGRQYMEAAGEITGLNVGHLRVGTAYYEFYPWIASLIADFQKLYPGVRIDIVENGSSRLVRAIENREIEMAFISKRPGNHRFHLLFKDSLVAILPKDHPMAGEKTFRAIGFSQEPFIELLPGQDTDNARYFREHGIKPSIRYSTDDTPAAASMVEAGLGITCSNQIVAKKLGKRVALLPLSPDGTVEMGLAMAPKASLSPAASRFLAFAEQRLTKINTEKFL